MGEIGDVITENSQNILGFFITWVIPFIVVFGAIYLGYWLKRPKPLENTVEKTKVGDFAIVWLGEDSYWIRDSKGNLSKLTEGLKSESIELVLEASLSINTLRLIQVESIELDIGGSIAKSNWESDSFYQPLAVGGLRFDIPQNIQRGRRTARLKTIVDGEPYLTEQFTITLPQKSKN